MSKIIMTDNGQQYQTPGIGKTIGAIYAGGVASTAISLGANIVNSIPFDKYVQKSQKNQDTVEVRNAIENAMQKTGLKAKGVEIIDVKTPTNQGNSSKNFRHLLLGEKTLEELHPENKKLVSALNDSMNDVMRNSFFGKIQLEQIVQMLEKGNNALFAPKNKIGGNKLILNIDKIGIAAFHEMGHAINFNTSKFWKSMQKMRTPMILTGGTLSLIALMKRPKAEGEEPKNVFDKTTTFIKNNVGKLVTLSFVPIIAEELKATSRGNKLAKELLSPETAKKVKTLNKFGAITYIASAGVSGLAAYVANIVRDAIAHPKEIQN